jgi:hypothetical protein
MDYEHHIYTFSNMIEYEPHGFTQTPPGSIALDCRTNSPRYDKTAACALAPVACDSQATQAMIERASIPPHTLKLFWAAQAISTFHNKKAL